MGAPLLAQMGKNSLQSGDLGFSSCVPKIPWRREVDHSSILAWRKIPWTEEPRGSYSPWGWQRVRPNSATNTFTRKNLLPQPCPKQPPRISVNPPALLQKQHKTNVHSKKEDQGDLLWEARRQSTVKDALKGAWWRAGSSAPFSGPQLGALSAQPAAWSSTCVTPWLPHGTATAISRNPPGAFSECWMH